MPSTSPPAFLPRAVAFRSVLRSGALLLAGLLALLLGFGGCASPGDFGKITTVIIDAGHGGHDSGALGRHRGLRVVEKDLALDTALRVERKLKAAGVRTVMVRWDDRFVRLDDRVAISNRHSDSLFLSIHYNYSRKRSVRGVEVYHNDRGTARFAHELATSVASSARKPKRFVQTASFRVLRKSRGPAVLVECGYLTHRGEAALCATEAHREAIADGIVRALLNRRR